MHDVGFYEMRQKVTDGEISKEFKLVNPAYTSRTCPRCIYVKKKCPFTQRTFFYESCGYIADRDLVGYLNVLSRAGSESS
ncbi:zinc ribbon domain-containing protein [Candidatus Acidianus copahuensis]|uniref:zinc ribbon domain-containing protein n=1 Tax=Candidatus Acidianus copahuensis TaxID=1160895 RepID=UPI001237817B|nr:zinc ribbon domain-containing protein [Candidatus Acidianus copahuensis]